MDSVLAFPGFKPAGTDLIDILYGLQDATTPDALETPGPITRSAPPPQHQCPTVPMESQPKSYIRPLSEQEWNLLKEPFRRLYVVGDLTLSEAVRRIMEQEDLHATERQWKGKIKQWGFNKYERPQVVKSLETIIQQENLSERMIIDDPKYLQRRIGYRWQKELAGTPYESSDKIFRNHRRRLKNKARKENSRARAASSCSLPTGVVTDQLNLEAPGVSHLPSGPGTQTAMPFDSFKDESQSLFHALDELKGSHGQPQRVLGRVGQPLGRVLQYAEPITLSGDRTTGKTLPGLNLDWSDWAICGL